MSNEVMTVDDELRMWKEAALPYFIVLFWSL